MMVLAMLAAMASQSSVEPHPAPACRAARLRLSLDGRDGDFNGMSHSGTALVIRNRGADCTLPALPTIEWRDKRGRLLAAARKVPIGMHPGPVMLPVRLAAGHLATADLRWVSGPVFPQNRAVHVAAIDVRWGRQRLRAPLSAVLYGNAAEPVGFDQTPLDPKASTSAR